MSQVPKSGTANDRHDVRRGSPVSIHRLAGPHIAFFGHDSTESTIIKRVEAFQSHGARVTGFMFRRLHDKIALAPSWRNIGLGATYDGRYLRRVAQLFWAMPTVVRNRKALRDADIIYARNADMLAVAVLSRFLTGAKAPIVYEALDVQPAFIGTSLVARGLRLFERRLLAASRLLVVSSPSFISRYFEPIQNYTGAWHLLENKVVLRSGTRPQRANRRQGHGKPWVIGWFGVIRCQRSLAILEKIAAAYPDDVAIHIRGLPSETNGITADLLRQASARHGNFHFFGPYHSPRDLEDIYGKVDLVWAVDFSAAGSNSDWLIPNRLYEGGLYCVPSIARHGTATGDIVARDGSGWCLEEPLEQTLAEFINSLDEACVDAVSHHLGAMDRSKFVDDTDTDDLLARLTQIAASEHGNVAPEQGRTRDAKRK